MVAALLLRENQLAGDGERRPSRPDPSAPDLQGLRRVPVAVDAHAAPARRSRPGPRNPLHRIGATAGPATAGLPGFGGPGSPAGIPGFAVAAVASLAADESAGCGAVGAGGDGSVSSRAAVSSCSSAVGVHRHASCRLASPSMPSMRARSHTPLPRRIAAAIVAHRTPREDRRDRMAPATRNGGTVAESRMNNIPPARNRWMDEARASRRRPARSAGPRRSFPTTERG